MELLVDNGVVGCIGIHMVAWIVVKRSSEKKRCTCRQSSIDIAEDNGVKPIP